VNRLLSGDALHKSTGVGRLCRSLCHLIGHVERWHEDRARQRLLLSGLVSVLSTPVNVSDLLTLPEVGTGLDRVETALGRSVGSQDAFLGEVATHLIAAGGKRLRPALVVAAALAGGGEISDDVVQGAVSVELVHLGSLYHDDVIDEAESRRGVSSVNARWGNLVAIVAGDFLLARASEIAASLGTEVAGLLAATIARLCEGEVSEIQHKFDTDRPESAYLAAISGKTASLMATACRIGALTARLGPSEVEALTAFGESFGMVFQIRDDVLDIVGTDAGLGKPAGLDMVEGVYTLPVLRALGTPVAGPELRALLGSPLDSPARDKAREIVRASGGVEAACAVARRYADQAAGVLATLDGKLAVPALAGLGHHLLDTLAG
jgi:heptaprenyl diphosphate synthase